MATSPSVIVSPDRIAAAYVIMSAMLNSNPRLLATEIAARIRDLVAEVDAPGLTTERFTLLLLDLHMAEELSERCVKRLAEMNATPSPT